LRQFELHGSFFRYYHPPISCVSYFTSISVLSIKRLPCLSLSFPHLMSTFVQNQQYSLPYQTTSTQAFETTMQAKVTLAGGVGYGAPRHNNRPIASNIKRKKSNRFNICGCVGDADLYDDDLNTSFHASRGPGEKIIGQIRQAGSFVQVAPHSAPTVEYSSQEAHPRKRTKTVEQDFVPSRSAPSPEARLASSINNMSPSQTSSSNSTGTASPEAQLIASIRAMPAETFLPRDDELASLRREETYSSPSPPLQLQHALSSNALQDGFYVAPQLDPSPTENKCHAEQQVVAPVHRQRRRGGYIGASSSSIPLIDFDEAPSVKKEPSDVPLPFRASVASTMSQYSVPSPCIDFEPAPKRATMGGPAPPANSTTDRNSLTSTNRTLSVGTTSSLSGSPAIGDVLSHFPDLPGMEDDVDDELSRPKRINTFGTDRRREYDYMDEYGVDRINSFHYSDGTLALDLCRPPSSSCDSSPCSTPSSSESIQTGSSGLSSRSQKRAAVMCRLPSHHDLAALSRCTDEGDLTWEEKVLKLTKGRSSSSEPEEIYPSDSPEADDTIEFTGDQTISQRCSKETIRSTTTGHKRGRGSSSTGPGPFSPPPNLPLPPVPYDRRTCPALRSQKSMMSVAAHHHSSYQQPSFRATLPRSTTCPDLGDSGYAF
jgi:hypothetical protein